MERVLEPEYMDTADEAEAYDAMDHSGPNAAFVERLMSLGARGRMLDIGTGPAHIPILVAERDPEAELRAIDAAEHMLRVARANLARQPAAVARRITLELADAKGLPYPDASFDTVFSNTILHHIPNPRPFLAEAYRVLRPGGVLLVRDLFRPTSEAERDRLVELYTVGSNDSQRELFRASLHAALRPDELRAIVAELGLSRAEVVIDTDRHMSLQLSGKVERPRLSVAGPRQRREEEERQPRNVEPERSRISPPPPIGAQIRPPQWSRRTGASRDESRRLAKLTEQVARALDAGERGRPLRKLLAQLPDGPFLDANWHRVVGALHLDAGQYGPAEKHYRAAQQRHPEWMELLHPLGRVYAATERFNEMVDAWLRLRAYDLQAPRPAWRLTEDEVVEAAEASLARLPENMRVHLRNLPIIVTDYPGEQLVREGVDPRILGIINGTPLPEKRHAMGDRPDLDVVQLYVRNLERISRDPEELRHEVGVTVIHEVLHYFGLDEDELANMGLD